MPKDSLQMRTPLFACIESESPGQKDKIDLARGRGRSVMQAGPTSEYTLHRNCPLPCTLQKPQHEKSCFRSDPTLSQTLNRGKSSCRIKIHPWDATHAQANGNNASVSQLSLGYAREALKHAGSFRLPALRISTLHTHRPIPLFMPGRTNSTTAPVTHIQRKEARGGVDAGGWGAQHVCLICDAQHHHLPLQSFQGTLRDPSGPASQQLH